MATEVTYFEFKIYFIREAKKDVISAWLDDMKDYNAKKKIRRRLSDLNKGNLGDWKSLRESIYELRCDAYRIYYAHKTKNLLRLLLGGQKDDQERDIPRAIQNLKDWKERGDF